jgi:hypothetical protein
MSLVIQSSEAIISFSERVSHASRRGSKISRGWSPARSARTNSSAFCVLSRSGVDRLASRDAAIVSSAEVISTEETGFPLGTVSERRWFDLLGEGAEGKELVDMDGDSMVWVPLSCMRGRLPLREVDDTTGRATFSGGVGGKPGEDGASGRETGLTTWTPPK